MTTAEILEALKVLPPEQRRALGLALLRGEAVESTAGESPVDSTHAWPVFTSPLADGASNEDLDHRTLRESRIDELIQRALSEGRI